MENIEFEWLNLIGVDERRFDTVKLLPSSGF